MCDVPGGMGDTLTRQPPLLYPDATGTLDQTARWEAMNTRSYTFSRSSLMFRIYKWVDPSSNAALELNGIYISFRIARILRALVNHE